jgi:O-antigen/teichoic acid export membrane protein
MIGFFANSAIPVLMSPIYYRYFGATDFGLIATVNGILAMTSVMDFGIASVLSQRMAASTRNGIVVVSKQHFRLYSGLTVCLSATIGGCSFLLLHHFGTLIHDRVGTNTFIVISIVLLATVERWRLFALAILRAGDRHTLVNSLAIAFSLIAAAVPFLGCMYLKKGFEVFLYLRCTVTLIEIVTMNLVAAKYLKRSESSDHSDGNKKEIAWQILYGSVSSVFGVLTVWIDRIAVFWSSSIEIYGKYVVVSSAVLFTAGIVNSVSQAFFPTLVRSTKGDGESPQAVWTEQMRISLVLCTPVCAFLFVDPIFVRELFFGQSSLTSDEFDTVVRFLSLYGFMSALTRIVNSYQVAYGRNEIAVSFNLFSAFFYYPLVFILARNFGVIGVAAGSVAYLVLFLTGYVLVTGRILKDFDGRKMLVLASGYFILLVAISSALSTVWTSLPIAFGLRIVCAIATVGFSAIILIVIDPTARVMFSALLMGVPAPLSPKRL